MATITFRDTIRKISPTWLQYGFAWRLLYVFGLHLDAIAEGANAAVLHRFPGSTLRFDSLPAVGADRKILRGRYESDSNYARRLRGWLDTHRIRGNMRGLLRQTWIYWGGTVELVAIYLSGRYQRLTTGGTLTDSTIPGWDPTPHDWTVWDLLLTWPAPIGYDAAWGSFGAWDDGGVWDYDLTVEEAEQIRLVPQSQLAAHSTARIHLVNETIGLWDYPIDTWADGGTWTDDEPPIFEVRS